MITTQEASIFACIVAAVVALYVRKRNAFGIVSKSFIEAFAPEVAMLQNPAITKDIRDMLIEAFPRHSEAVVLFRHNLGFISKRQFDKAWKQYHSDNDLDPDKWGIQPKDRLFLEYFNIKHNSDPVEIYLIKINTLLKFAKQT